MNGSSTALTSQLKVTWALGTKERENNEFRIATCCAPVDNTMRFISPMISLNPIITWNVITLQAVPEDEGNMSSNSKWNFCKERLAKDPRIIMYCFLSGPVGPRRAPSTHKRRNRTGFRAGFSQYPECLRESNKQWPAPLVGCRAL